MQFDDNDHDGYNIDSDNDRIIYIVIMIFFKF